jgi:hypothetical protein
MDKKAAKKKYSEKGIIGPEKVWDTSVRWNQSLT